MPYASSYKPPKTPRPHHVTVDGVRVLLTPIPWGWQVVLDGTPIGCVWRVWEYTDANNAEVIEWSVHHEPCPDGSEEERCKWLSDRNFTGLDCHCWTRRAAIHSVLEYHAKRQKQ